MRTIILLLLVTCCYALKAQQVVSNAGSTLNNYNGSISFTIGEGIAQTLTKGDKTITQGFHQTNMVAIVSEIKDLDFSIYVFPNPTSEMLTLKLSKKDVAGMQYQILDINGKLLSQKNLESAETSIFIGQLHEGLYILKVQTNTKVLKTFKIIKQ